MLLLEHGLGAALEGVVTSIAPALLIGADGELLASTGSRPQGQDPADPQTVTEVWRTARSAGPQGRIEIVSGHGVFARLDVVFLPNFAWLGDDAALDGATQAATARPRSGRPAASEPPMSRPLRALVVEDSADDAAFCLLELRRAGFDPSVEVVADEAGYRAGLREHWDIVLCDYTMPTFSGTEALLILRGEGLETPFIFVSGTIGEEAAVAAMRDGAQDYIVKTNLRRLGAAVTRALGEAAARIERDRAVEGMRAAEGRLASVLAMAPDAIIAIDDVGRITIFNRAAEVIFGCTAADAKAHPVGRLIPDALDLSRSDPMLDELLRDSQQRHRRAAALFAREALEQQSAASRAAADARPMATWRAWQQGAQTTERLEITCRRWSGDPFAAEICIARFADPGRVRDLAIIRDVSERRALEEQLRQSQKMEAVGQLTGGIAHDFNNLLTVILGNLDLVLQDTSVVSDPDGLAMIESAFDAGRKGADLVRHLLVFSRRQPLSPQTIELNALAAGTIDFLRRALGEQIEIVFLPLDVLWTTSADRVQLESALANLALSARDAMPDGGRLVVATRNVTLAASPETISAGLQAGDFVEIALKDTGTGMSPDVLAKATEPFFTTKDEGKGTGLGLSMVFGFARQSGGDLRLESRSGHGTTARLLLPRATQGVARAAAQTQHVRAARAHARVLVVDDNDSVRRILVTALVRQGYRVIEASDGPSAMEVLGSPTQVDLLLSDIIMPHGMYGPALAKQARLLRPELRVLFTSGNAAVADGYIDEIRAIGDLLPKPWTNAELAEAVRAALEAGRDTSSL